MHSLGLLAAAAAAAVTAGSTTAVAATTPGKHCDDHDTTGVTKVELDGEVTHLDLPAGTVICVKSSTGHTGRVVVGPDGFTKTLVDHQGNVRGISYYVVYGTEEPPCDPHDYGSDCYHPGLGG